MAMGRRRSSTDNNEMGFWKTALSAGDDRRPIHNWSGGDVGPTQVVSVVTSGELIDAKTTCSGGHRSFERLDEGGGSICRCSSTRKCL